jgi:hypothetical protein
MKGKYILLFFYFFNFFIWAQKGCQEWTPCNPGKYLAVANFRTITADRLECTACSTDSDGSIGDRYYMPEGSLSNGISQKDSNNGGQTGKFTCT